MVNPSGKIPVRRFVLYFSLSVVVAYVAHMVNTQVQINCLVVKYLDKIMHVMLFLTLVCVEGRSVVSLVPIAHLLPGIDVGVFLDVA